jgi:hypothetical protein
MFGIAVNTSGLFVAVGFNGSFQTVYATSTNGSTWTTPALMNGSTAQVLPSSIACDSTGRFVAVARDDATGAPMYATSTDGTTWTTPALMNGSTAYANMRSVAVSSTNKFVSVGFNSASPSTQQGVYAVATF